jgi:hypothetical protein
MISDKNRPRMKSFIVEGDTMKIEMIYEMGLHGETYEK